MSVSTRWAPPKTSGARTEDAPSPRWLDSCDGELAFFRALIDHRPIGPTKHWAMIDICGALKKASEQEYRRMPLDDPWRKYHELYTAKIIEKNFTVQAEDAEDPEPDPLTTRADFDLSQAAKGDYEFVTIFEDKATRTASGSSAPSSPLRDISLPPGVVTTETQSPRHGGAAGKGAGGTKRLRHSRGEEGKEVSKKAAPSAPMTRGDDAGSSGTSELSELDEEEEEEEEEAETESAAESGGGDEYTDAPAVPSALPDTAAAIRSLPSSKRNRAQSPGPSTTRPKPRAAKARKASKKDGGR